MSNHILRCMKCNKYTMRQACPHCGEKTIPQIPAKYSPEDPYGRYRREAKKDMLKEKGVL